MLEIRDLLENAAENYKVVLIRMKKEIFHKINFIF